MQRLDARHRAALLRSRRRLGRAGRTAKSDGPAPGPRAFSIASCRPTSTTSPSSAGSRRRASPRTAATSTAFGRVPRARRRRRRRERRAPTSAGTWRSCAARGLSSRSASRALSAVRGLLRLRRAPTSAFRKTRRPTSPTRRSGSRCRRASAKAEVEALLAAPDARDAARAAGPRDARAPLRLGPARLGDREPAARRGGPRGRDPARHGQGRQGAARALRQVGGALARALPRGGPAGPRPPALGAPLSLRAGRRDDPPALLAADRGLRPQGRNPRAPDAPRPAPLVRDAPARARGRPARPPDDARARRHRDDPDLHAGLAGAAAPGLRRVPPPGEQGPGRAKMGR